MPTKVTRVGICSVCIFSILMIFLLSSCGSGGGSGDSNGSGGSGSNPPPIPGFTVAASPSSLTVSQGGTGQKIQVQVAAKNGFSGSVKITPGDLTAGLSVEPKNVSANPGDSVTFTFSASPTAAIVQQSIILVATSGTIKVDTPLPVSVNGAPTPDPFHYLGGLMIHGFYDDSRKLLFASNPVLNEIDVISVQDFSVKSRVPAPQPWAIDQMPDDNTLVVGTAAQQIFTMDEDTFQIEQHPFAASGIGSAALFFPLVVSLANGKVLMVGQEEGIDSGDILDGGQELYEWDSNANTFSQIVLPGQNNQGQIEIDSFARSADHKWAVFSADQFYLYSADSDSLRSIPLSTAAPPDGSFGVRGYAINADGSEIAAVSATSVTFLDNSLTPLHSSSIPSAFQTVGTAVQFSPDSTKLLVQYDYPLAIEELDATTYQPLGYVSGDVTQLSDRVRLFGIDSTSRGFVGIFGGIRVVDLNQTPVPNGDGNFNGDPNCSISPTAVALNETSKIQLFERLTQLSIYIGGQPAPLLSGGLDVSVPASSTVGPVDIECIGTNGDTFVIADGASYGVDPVGLSANLLPPSGGQTVYVYGFGFAADNFEVPSITLGGRAVTNVASIQDIDFGTLEGAAFKTPSGTAGESVSVGVSSSLGSGTLSAAASYYAAPKILSDSGLKQLLYDTHRNLLYALKGGEIQVLNPASLNWQASIPLPQGGSTVNYQFMALSPDGSYLVADSQDGHIAVLNPSQPTQASLVQLPTGVGTTGSLAITEFNQVIIPGLGAEKLDLSTLAFSSLNENTGQIVRASADGTHIYGVDLNNSGGAVYSIDPSTFEVHSESFGQEFWTDLAVNATGSQFAAVFAPPYLAGDAVGFFDPGLRYLNTNAYPDYATPDDTGVLGAMYSPGGQVLLVALGDSIELWDAAQGTLRACLMTSEELNVLVYPENAVAPQLATDSTGQTIYAISAGGLMVLKLPSPMDQMPAQPWPHLFGGGSQSAWLHGPIRSRMAAAREKLHR